MIILLVLAIASSIYVGITAIRDREPNPATPATSPQAGRRVAKRAAGRASVPAAEVAYDADVRWSPIDDMQLTRLLQRAARGD